MKMTVAAGKNCRAFGARLESDGHTCTHILLLLFQEMEKYPYYDLKYDYTRVCYMYHDMMMCVFIFHSMDECNIHISLSS